jgi:hypothetical protein
MTEKIAIMNPMMIKTKMKLESKNTTQYVEIIKCPMTIYHEFN